MKFGIRIPSVKKRISARTSWKRVARHSVGLKAPRGWGWVTNPKKAAYNRVYNRTTVGFGGKSASGCGSTGCATLVLGCAVVSAFSSSAFLASMAVATVGVSLVVIAWVVHRRKNTRRETLEHQQRILLDEQALAEVQRERELAAAAEEERRKQRYAALETRFGIDVAQSIWKREIWQGATVEMITESLGDPLDVKQRVYKTKTKTTYCYHRLGANRYALRIHFENGVVVGWDEK